MKITIVLSAVILCINIDGFSTKAPSEQNSPNDECKQPCADHCKTSYNCYDDCYNKVKLNCKYNTK